MIKDEQLRFYLPHGDGIKRDYMLYVKLCKKYDEEPKKEQPYIFWLEHYDVLLVKYNIHYNR